MNAFQRMAVIDASTKRAQIANGQRGEPVTHIAAMKCTPLDPVSSEQALRVGLESPYELLQTLTEETDVREGDVLVVDGVDYPIRAVGDWLWRVTGASAFCVLVLEDLKRGAT